MQMLKKINSEKFIVSQWGVTKLETQTSSALLWPRGPETPPRIKEMCTRECTCFWKLYWKENGLQWYQTIVISKIHTHVCMCFGDTWCADMWMHLRVPCGLWGYTFSIQGMAVYIQLKVIFFLFRCTDAHKSKVPK